MTTKYIIPPLRSTYTKIKALQKSIVDSLYPYGQFNNNTPFYLIEEKDFTSDFNVEEYANFLSFTSESIKSFKSNSQQIKTFIYNPSETEEDNREILKKKEIYGQYADKDYHLDIMKESIKLKHTQKNDDDYFFEKKDDMDIVKMIRDVRLPSLKECAMNPNKSEEDKEYFSIEADRLEKIFTDNPDISLGELSDKIIWSATSMLEQISGNNNSKLNSRQHPTNIIDTFNKDENEKYILQLMTYMPLEYFEKNENGKWKIKSTEMKQFLSDSYRNDNIQQMVLGLTPDLANDFFKQFRQLAHCYSFQWDSFNNCNLVDWSMKLNFLVIYLFSKSVKKVFPIRFKMPKIDFAYNSVSDLYSFKKSYKLSASLLFNKKPEITIMGITLFNTNYNSSFSKKNPKKNTYNLSNSNKKYNKRIFIILHCKIDLDKKDKLSSKVLSIWFEHKTGVSKRYIDFNIFLSQIGNGLFENQGFTHQELMILTKYYKLNSYIIKDDMGELFFTSRDESNEELKEIIEKLGMKKVKLETVEDKLSAREQYRIKIGGYTKTKKSRNIKTRNIKTRKTKKTKN